MALPLIQRAKEDGVNFVLILKRAGESANAAEHCGTSVGNPRLDLANQVSRIPSRLPAAGEQYRFHFDMNKCIGCKCCVVACNEQNGNPAEINWRRVGEIEGGWYPNTQRFHLSMGCNHCLEPTCLEGCPVDAYSKDSLTGIVLHSAEICIGCQYCTWNCSYGVPQYNPERGVVGKCDMCQGRLSEGREPACVSACPEVAIEIEIVNIAEWKRDYAASANAPGLPSADDSISSTRLSLPAHLPPDTKKADFYRVKPEPPHWPLVVMTVLTQLSVGAFATIWLLQVLGKAARLGVASMAAFFVAALALGASTLHLGRPIHAYRAVKMWKRSWLSREVLFFGAFSGVASMYAALLWMHFPGSAVAGSLTTLVGIAGATSSAYIYLVPARPAWNNKHTLAEFYLTGAVLGPLFAASIGVGESQWLVFAALTAAVLQLLNLAAKFFWLIASDAFELQASARLISTSLGSVYLARASLLILGGIILPLFFRNPLGIVGAFVAALLGEILGRYLFFVSVVPKNMAASYVAVGEAAA